MKLFISSRHAKKVQKKLKKKGYDIAHLIDKTNELANRELDHELVIDTTIKQVKIISDELDVKNLGKNSRAYLNRLRKIKKALRMLRLVIHRTKKFNDEDIKYLRKIIETVESYQKDGNKLNSALKHLLELCSQKKQLREHIDELLVSTRKPVDKMLVSIDKALDKKITRNKLIEELQNEKKELIAMIEDELKIYGIEVDLLKKTVGIEQLRNVMFNYADEKSFRSKKLTLIKRSYLMKRLRKAILVSVMGMHLAGIGVSTVAMSTPVVFWAYNNNYQEMVQKHAHEEVTFKARDGYSLKGWFFNNPNTDKTIVICHGRSSNKSYEMPYIQDMVKKYNVFAFDFRHHGDDSWGTTSIGYHEIKDLQGALDLMASRGIHDVALFGHSMGGAVAIMTAVQYRSPNLQIRTIVTEGAYADLNGVLEKAGRLVPRTISWPAKKLSQAVAGYKVSDVEPVKYIGGVNCPILLLQAKEDKVIPANSAKRLYRAAQGIKSVRYFHGEHNVPNNQVSQFAMEFLGRYF